MELSMDLWYLNNVKVIITQIGTRDDKLFSNQILSRESLLCAKTASESSLKADNANAMPLLSRNLKIQHPRNKLIPYKSPALWKTQANLFQNFPNWNTGREHVFKPNCVKRILALCKTCKKTSSKAKQSKRSAFIV